MYIDDIDKIWDETINNYFSVWIIQKTKELINIDTLINETNFVKFQKDINKSFDLSFSIISQEKIKSYGRFKFSLEREPNQVSLL